MVDLQEGGKTLDVVINNSLIEHLFFNYVTFEQKQIIIERLQSKQSIVCGFKDGEKMLFCAVFDFEPNCLHVREVGGYFGRIHEVLNIFAEGFAKFLKVDMISLNTEKRAVKAWAENKGFVPVPDCNEFVKVLH